MYPDILTGMEAVIFIGIQAIGKSSFYKRRFFRMHVRINLYESYTKKWIGDQCKMMVAEKL